MTFGRMVTAVAVLMLVVAVEAPTLAIYTTESMSYGLPDSDDRPAPPEPEPDPPNPDPPFDPDLCIEYFDVYTCPGVREIPRNDYTRSIDGVCTGDEGNNGAALRTCGFADEAEPIEDDPDEPDLIAEPDPDPDEPTPPVPVTEITGTDEFACDAPEPQLDLPSVDFPTQDVGALPEGTADAFGVTGLETWVWADGLEQYLWAVTEFGEEGFTTWARDGLYYPDDDRIEWGSTYAYEEAFWACATYGFWTAEIGEWQWTLSGPEDVEIIETSGTSGSAPNPYGEGDAAAAHLMPETKGHYTLRLDTVWEGSWGGSWTHHNGSRDYQINEIRSQLDP